ncbi:MAG: MoaD/ThiS family protein [Planctomycetes bacterium]|nr:MoaD/ThiS family protein [Planctomycetota bacterium]
MASVHFTSVIQRHVACPTAEASGETVRAVLESVFADHANLRSYLLDDQGALRKHVTIFVDGEQVRDRAELSHPVGPHSRLDVMQALSGG